MNGIDSICAVLTLILILVFSPLLQFKELTEEIKIAVVKEAMEEKPPDREYISEAMKLMDREWRVEAFTWEGKRNGELYPYIFRERLKDAEEAEEGKVIYYGF
ncbi:MAG: hypothetical protein K6F63_01890 [Lachnospiraceae bacterium]|nr:hypothetical protein [Lachnospiraceae bacterium]